MSRRFASVFAVIILTVSLSACNLTTSGLQAPNETEVALQVAATMSAIQATMQAGGQKQAQPPQQPQATSVPSTSGQNNEPTGSITGGLTFANGEIPALRVVAFEVAEGRPTGQYYYIVTTPGQTAYEMTQLPATTYFVIAYTLPSYSGQPMAAGYTQAVTCGLSANCTDHNLIAVQVNAGQSTQSINPTDWNAPPEIYPNDPVG